MGSLAGEHGKTLRAQEAFHALALWEMAEQDLSWTEVCV